MAFCRLKGYVLELKRARFRNKDRCILQSINTLAELISTPSDEGFEAEQQKYEIILLQTHHSSQHGVNH